MLTADNTAPFFLFSHLLGWQLNPLSHSGDLRFSLFSSETPFQFRLPGMSQLPFLISFFIQRTHFFSPLFEAPLSRDSFLVPPLSIGYRSCLHWIESPLFLVFRSTKRFPLLPLVFRVRLHSIVLSLISLCSFFGKRYPLLYLNYDPPSPTRVFSRCSVSVRVPSPSLLTVLTNRFLASGVTPDRRWDQPPTQRCARARSYFGRRRPSSVLDTLPDLFMRSRIRQRLPVYCRRITA